MTYPIWFQQVQQGRQGQNAGVQGSTEQCIQQIREQKRHLQDKQKW